MVLDTSGKRREHNDEEVSLDVVAGSSEEDRFGKDIPARSNTGRRVMIRTQNSLKTLAFAEMYDRANSIGSPYLNSCEWITQTSYFQDWMMLAKQSQHHGFMWIKGKPGVGKSTIMKYLLERVKNTSDSSTIILSFFFNVRGSGMARSSAGMYRTLLHQLLEQAPEVKNQLPDTLGTLLDVQSVFWEVVETTIGYFRWRPLICFIDALDEANEGQMRDIVAFFENLVVMAIARRFWIRICFSSRHWPRVTSKRGLTLVVEEQQGHHQDLAAYVRTKLRNVRFPNGEAVDRAVIQRASGSFLWATLTTYRLNRAFEDGRDNDLKQILDEAPQEMEAVYDLLLLRSGVTERSLLWLCLKWILFARRPLKAVELYHAMRFASHSVGNSGDSIRKSDKQEARDFVRSSSCGLAETTDSGDVRFIHDTVHRYLLRDNGSRLKRPNSKYNVAGSSHNDLAHCCLIYIRWSCDHTDVLVSSLPPANSQDWLSQTHTELPFLNYAVTNVLHHANIAAQHGLPQMEFIEGFSGTQWPALHGLFTMGRRSHFTETAGDLSGIFKSQGASYLVRELKAMQTKDILEQERHPKAEENTSEEPPSAYVLFANRVREEVRSQNLSSAELAKLVGDRWQKLDASQRQTFEAQAGLLREQHDVQRLAYKQTEAHSDNAQYLSDFNAKDSPQTETEQPKLDSGSVEEAWEREFTKFVEQEDNERYRCKVPGCTKLFTAERFWRKHVENRHQEWYSMLKNDLELVDAHAPKSPDPLADIQARPIAEYSSSTFIPPPDMNHGMENDGTMAYNPTLDQNMNDTDWFTLPLDQLFTSANGQLVSTPNTNHNVEMNGTMAYNPTLDQNQNMNDTDWFTLPLDQLFTSADGQLVSPPNINHNMEMNGTMAHNPTLDQNTNNTDWFTLPLDHFITSANGPLGTGLGGIGDIDFTDGRTGTHNNHVDMPVQGFGPSPIASSRFDADANDNFSLLPPTNKIIIHHFTCRSLSIGSWRRVGQNAMDLVIFYSTDKARMTYYINNDSAGYKIEFPFAFIKNITLEPGDSQPVDGSPPRPGGLVIELTQPPLFFMDSVGSDGFYQCQDFTEDQQASSVLVHHLSGHPKVLSGQLAKLASLDIYQNRHVYHTELVHLDTHSGHHNHFDVDPAQNAEHSHPPGSLSFGPATDSGYASLKHDKSVHLRNSLAEIGAQSPAPNDMAEPTVCQEERDSDDAATVYSDAASLNSIVKDSHKSELADALMSNIRSGHPDDQTMERILDILPDLLKAFALSIGHGRSDTQHLDIMHFVHKYRYEIVEHLRTNRFEIEKDTIDAQVAKPDKPPLEDIMDRWYENCEDSDEPEISDLAESGRGCSPGLESENEQEDEDDSRLALPAYRDIIFRSSSYEWLLATLQRESILTPAKPNVMATIRHKIMTSLPVSHSVSRRKSSQSLQVVFHIAWDPFAFFRQQGYSHSPREVIQRVVTLTGTLKDAQALSCVQYLHQTWPFSGKHVIELIRGILECVSGHKCTCDLPDGTVLTAWTDGSELLVSVLGTASSIADTGEQLAWLGAALRPSSHEVGIASCTAYVHDILDSKVGTDSEASSGTNKHLAIKFIDSKPEPRAEFSNGQCWHYLFKNPIVVEGFPIPRRSEKDTGLEIPLHMMAGIAQTQHIDTFKNNVFIKGFSTMLVPTKCNGGVLNWHLIYNKGGERVSYLDGNHVHAEGVTMGDLENARHVLGWCSSIKYSAGTVDANYVIEESGLRGSHSKCKLKNVHVSRGKLIRGGEPYILGDKDQPHHITRDTYSDKLSWISKKNVVLWDVKDQRGWLINGSSALLHLLRTSLRSNQSDELKSRFVFQPERLKDLPTPHDADSAIEVLLNPNNQSIEIHLEEITGDAGQNHELPASGAAGIVKSYSRLRHRVERLYNMLEKMIDHQVEMSGRNGDELRDLPRQDIEGWDFADLATNEDPLYPRVLKMRTMGKGWVDFSRSIHAVVLFGNEFGEIIRPSSPDSSCRHWNTLPCGKCYLAVSMSDLSRIIKRHGSRTTFPIRVTDDLIWHHHDIPPDPCRCTGKEQTTGCNLAQSLLPDSFRTKLLQSSRLHLPEKGAVVFGHNTALGYFWTDRGDPEQGTIPPSPTGSEIDFNDSAIGSSMNASALADEDTQTARPCPTAGIVRALAQKDYKVAIICALPKELLAVRALFDHVHPKLKIANQDDTFYTFGRLGEHNVVAACLPSDEYGTNSATSIASHMLRSFRALKICLLVGIGGGVPSHQNDIRLGDVIVSTSVIQHDLGKALQNSDFKRTGLIRRPPKFLMNVISELRSDPLLSLSPLRDYVKVIESVRPEYKHPGHEHDKLFQADFAHALSRETCDHCQGPQVPRSPRQSDTPQVFYGPIASGNQVVKDAMLRDSVNKDGQILCFEMEAAGVMITEKFLVIRGICDYADSHKNNIWQEYAAATAAAYAKFFLSRLPTTDVVERISPQIEQGSSSLSRRGTWSEYSASASGSRARKRRRSEDV